MQEVKAEADNLLIKILAQATSVELATQAKDQSQTFQASYSEVKAEGQEITRDI